MIAWTSSHLMAPQIITRITQAKALEKIVSVSSTTNSSKAITIATLYISAGFLGGDSSLSSAVHDLICPFHKESSEIFVESGALPSCSNTQMASKPCTLTSMCWPSSQQRYGSKAELASSNVWIRATTDSCALIIT